MKSEFISGMWLEEFTCVSAEKNITVGAEYKYIMVNLEFQSDYGKFKISSSFAVNAGGKISQKEAAKVAAVYSTNGQVSSRARISSVSDGEYSDELLAAINDINELFDQADIENKKVYM